MNKSLLMLLTLFSLSVFANDDAAETAFAEGNRNYAEGKFEEAAASYNSIIKEGYFSADLHYNLGNAYYKLDSIPKAILHYEKALRLNPRMHDAQKNLKLAQIKTIDKIEPLPDVFLSKWWKTLLNLFHPDGWASLAVAFMFIALLGIIIYLFTRTKIARKTGFILAITAVLLSLTALFLGFMKNSYLQNSTEAIVMTPTINVYSSPTEGSTKLFVLHKGTKVDLENRSGVWVQIRISDGNEGWIKQNELAEI